MSRSCSTIFQYADITPLTKLSDNDELFVEERNVYKSAAGQLKSLTVVGATTGDMGRCEYFLSP